MLKKAICLLFSFLIIISLCACTEKEAVVNPDNYISDAAVTQCGTIIDSNQMLYNEVFVLGHLSVDEKKSIEKDGKKYAPVTDNRFSSYADLADLVNMLYTEDCAKSILKTYNYYKDIDGVLYYDLSCKEKIQSGLKWERSSDEEVELEKKIDESYTLEFFFVSGKKDCRQEFVFVKTDSGYRLTEFKSAR